MTNLDAFFVVLAFGYIIHGSSETAVNSGYSIDISFIAQLKGQFRINPVLGLSLAICLFSMAGIPPLIGFFAKYMVLYSAIENGYYFLALVGIMASVVSAAYYLRIIRVIHFDSYSYSFPIRSTIGMGTGNKNNGQTSSTSPMLTTSSVSSVNGTSATILTSSGTSYPAGMGSTADGNTPVGVLSSTHSYVIAVLTLFIALYILSPSLFLNSSNLLALSLFTA